MARETHHAPAKVTGAASSETPPATKRTTKRAPRRSTKRAVKRVPPDPAPAEAPAENAEASTPVAEPAVPEASAADADTADGRKRTRRGRRGGTKRRTKKTARTKAAEADDAEAAVADTQDEEAPSAVAEAAPAEPPPPPRAPEPEAPAGWPVEDRPERPTRIAASTGTPSVTAPTPWTPATPIVAARTSPPTRPRPRSNEPFGAGLVEDSFEPPPTPAARVEPPATPAPRAETTPASESTTPPAPTAPPATPGVSQSLQDRYRDSDNGETGGDRTGRRRSRRRGGRGRRRNGRRDRDEQDADSRGQGRPVAPPRPEMAPSNAGGSRPTQDELPAVNSELPALTDDDLSSPSFLDETAGDVIPLNDDDASAPAVAPRDEQAEEARRGRSRGRRSRGGRGRRRRSGEREASEDNGGAVRESADDELDVEPIEEGPEDELIVEPEPEPLDDVEPKRSRRGRRSRKKAAAEAAGDEAELDETEPAQEVPIQVIDAAAGRYTPVAGRREMIMNVTRGAEVRVAVLHEGRLEELYIERQSAVSHVGNIYMGRITNVEPSIQAAFVDFGMPKNGFLHISDVQPRYFPGGSKLEPEPVGKKVPRRDRPPIQKCFRRGDKVIVQVVKEGVGTKGPTLTTYLSIPGRFVVMMPGMNRLGVSRKIEDDAARRAMRDLLSQLTLPDNMGFILRTAGLDRNRRELQSDLNYLQRLWKTVEERIATNSPPCELYQESDLVIRTIRDVYASDFSRIVVDDPETAEKARAFLRVAMPRTAGQIVEYRRPEPIFHYFGLEEEIRRLHSRHVPLASGGSIVIDTTEAMVTIDVNSGKFRELQDAEETAFRINLEAAEEIARQLRLRDLGGIVVCDFIDLRLDRHKRAVEKALRDALKKHKERARILRMSKFGIIEMTRQRQRPSIKRSIFVDCPHCGGSGHIKTAESMSLEIVRALQLLANRSDIARITVTLSPSVASLVLNDRRAFIHDLEQRTGKMVVIVPEPTFSHDRVAYEGVDYRGMPVKVEV